MHRQSKSSEHLLTLGMTLPVKVKDFSVVGVGKIADVWRGASPAGGHEERERG